MKFFKSINALENNFGLREMERDINLSYGIAQFLKERLMDSSDLFRVYISKAHKTIVVANPEKNLFIYNGKQLTRDQVTEIQLPYAMKLLLHEMIAIGIDPRIYTEN